MDRKPYASVGRLLYVSSISVVLDTPTGKITKGKSTARNVQVKKLVGVVSDFFKSGHPKTLEAAANAVCLVANSSADFPDSAFDAPIVEKECFERASP